MYDGGALNGYVPAYHAPSDPSDKGPKDKEQASEVGQIFPRVTSFIRTTFIHQAARQGGIATRRKRRA
jgi:hypothetical protein